MINVLRELAIDGYPWFAALHIVSVVCWFAALFYLPRLFVYHAMAEDRPGIERFKVMERKLYRGIATPSMVATLLFGGGLFVSSPHYYLDSTWFQLKLALVGLLIVYHFMCRRHLVQFSVDNNRHSHVFYRWFNEAPVLILIGVVVLVKVKPI